MLRMCVCLYSACYRKQTHMARDYEMHFKETRVKWTRRVGERAIDTDRQRGRCEGGEREKYQNKLQINNEP